MSSSCLSCSDPIAPCACSPGQQCVQTARSCNACAKNVCIDDGSSKSGSGGGGGGSSTGATAGGAVGGVLGVAAILVAIYFFWWKPRGLAASQRRYSKHLSHRQSRINEKRKTQLGGAGGATDANGVSKRSSVHLHVGDPGQEAVNRRNTSPGAGARTGEATGALTSRTSEEDNPFGDQNRSSIGTFDDAASLRTSEFSFRSSHSTNVIPIAYIPPHSSSISVADGQRGAFGEVGGTSAAPPPRSAAIRASIPTSMASRDSLALAGAEIIELNPLPPVLTPDTPAVPLGTTANGAPIRPPRSPGLDLQLPKSSAPLTSSPLASPSNNHSRPTSGFPFSDAPSSASSPAFLSADPSASKSRGMSVLGEPRAAPGHMSTFTTRSGTSTMSYILDPPQIITPFNSQGVRRVELQKGQAAVVQLGTSGSPNTPSSATEVLQSPSREGDNPFDDSAAEPRRHSRVDSQETVKNGIDSRPTSTATDTSRWTRSSLASDGAESVQFLQGQTVTFTNPNTPMPASPSPHPRLPNTMSIASAFDGPQSARSSEAFDTGSHIRPLTGGGMSLNMSRSSTASGTSDTSSHMSLLEGIPFMAPPAPGVGPSTSSVSLGLPVNVTATLDNTPASISAPTFPSVTSSSTAPPPLVPSTTAPSAPLDLFGPSAGEEDDDDPLPAPFLPFAGQRPTSSAPSSSGATVGSTPAAKPDRVQSEAFSVRSGFGSGLSQIPFQLGFPSGFGDDAASDMGDGASDRGSMISTVGGTGEGTRDSRFTASRGESYDEADRRDSFASDLGAVVVQEAVRTPVGSSPLAKVAVLSSSQASTPLLPSATSNAVPSSPTPSAPPAPSAPSAPKKQEEEEEEEEEQNPFADPRASVDSFALAAALSANLDAEAEGR